MRNFDDIQKLIHEGNSEYLLKSLNEQIAQNPANDELYYLRGKLFYRKGNWKEAIQNYMEAVHYNPESPAASALKFTTDILEYYNKDIYCQ